jgi:peptidoglycan/LPS O-acetylase OafA/YrhL
MFHRLYTGRGTSQTYAVLAGCFVLHNAWNWGGKTGTVLSVAMFACFFLVVAGRLGILRARPLLFLGAISYPLYLLHNNVGMIAIRELMSLGLSYNLALVAALALVIALSTAVTWGVEKPAMKWIRRRFERPAQTEASGP